MKLNNNNQEIKEKLELLKSKKTEDQLNQRESLILQGNYLSEIERLSRIYGFNRKELAETIKTSPSYLTQVFRGDKPLNFLTIAKIKRALNLRFYLEGELATEKKTDVTKFETHRNSPWTNRKNLRVILGDSQLTKSNKENELPLQA
jgi:ribosome-binding protein aMBF1 (putative translation factor)